jgi:protein TonB
MRSTPESFPSTSDREPATVEESSADLELITILRNAAENGTHSMDSIVDAVADAARVLSGADGTALGLETKGAIICRARSGTIAPPLGSPISTQSGISGECLRTASILVCNDAMADPRVDSEVCLNLGIRSIAAVPVRGSSRVAGILEAFSARASAFDGDGLIALQELAEIAEITYRRDTKARFVAAKPPSAIPPAPTYSTPPLATEEILDSVSQPGTRVKWVVGIALALLLTVAVAWWAWHTPTDEAANGAQNAHAAASQPTTPATHALAFVAKPAPGFQPGHPERARSGIVQNAADVKPIDLRPEAGAASGTPETVEVTGTTRPSAEAVPVPEPPAVNLAPSPSSQTLSQLTSVSPQMPVAAPRVSEGVIEATLIRRIEPKYPPQARTQRLQGRVTLSATIAVDGSVRDIAVVGGSPILAEAAKAAVRQWKYHPAKLNGAPVEVQKEVIVIFAQP